MVNIQERVLKNKSYVAVVSGFRKIGLGVIEALVKILPTLQQSRDLRDDVVKKAWSEEIYISLFMHQEISFDKGKPPIN